MEEVIHYGSYKFTITDWIIFLFGFRIKGFLISYLFYDSYVAIFMLIPFGYVDYRNEKLRKIEKRKQQLSNQFKEMLESLIAFLNAGYSLEYSMKHTRKDLELLFQDKSLLLRELDILLEGLKMNIPIENLLKDFGKRSEVEDIRNFANVVMVAKKWWEYDSNYRKSNS